MGFFGSPPPQKGAREKVKLPHKQRGKLTSYCSVCKRGVCGCRAIAAADRADAAKKNRPIPCGQRFASGGTCHKTAPCGRDHSKH